MKGYHPPRQMREDGAAGAERADRPGQNSARQQHIYSAAHSIALFGNSPPAAALTQPPPAPYQPPPITTFSDRVNNAIQAYPLQKGIGNNPTDQQVFIRQRLNQ